MKVALVQLNYIVGAFDINKTKIITNIHKAKEQGANLVVFAELAISGTPAYELLNMPPFMEMCEQTLVEIASHCDDLAVIIGLPIQHTDGTISAAALIQNRRVMRYIGKQHILTAEERGYLVPSKGCEYVKIKGRKVAIVLGDDLLTEQEYGSNADMVVGVCSHRYHRGIIADRYEFLSKLAYRTAADIVFVNHVGGQADMLYDGSSAMFNSKGEAIAILKSFEEDFAVVDLKSAPKIEIPKQSRVRNTCNALKMGLKDFFEKNRFTKACLGLSGGIDSAVVLALAVEALGRENVKALIMPSHFSSDHSVEDSLEMINTLGVEYAVIPITEAYKAINESMIPVIGGTDFGVAEENIQARIRMIMLMALSNKHGHIVLNTSNKSEAAVGYDTIYGDSAGSIGVIGDLYKIEVYELARYLNREQTIIPASIISKEPSAELRPDQKDTDSLPPYEMLDAILTRFIEEGQQVHDIIEAGFDDDLVRNVLNKLRLSSFKRYQGCPVLRVSRRPFESRYRIPLIEYFEL